MALQILGTGPDPDEVAGQLKAAIEAALDGAEAEVRPASAGHYEIRVVYAEFDGLSRLKQQQSVYAAIAPLMAGSNAPVHAIDRMECVVPE